MGRRLLYTVEAAARFVLFPIYYLSGLVPRRDDLWVFGSWGGHRFADNAAAFFLFCASRVGDAIQLVWISRKPSIVSQLRSQGYKAHWLWSPQGVFYCLRAGVFVFDCFAKDINFWLSRNAKKVNLWSGVPLKTFERDIDVPGSRYYSLFHGSLPVRWLMRFLMPWHVDRFSLLICTSPVTQAIVCSAFDVPEDKVAITGYPRNDVFFRKDTSSGSSKDLPKLLGNALSARKKIFLYLPTFRDSGRPYLRFDWPRLDKFLSDHDAKFFYKFHPIDASKININFEHIVALPKDLDVYDILPHTDALISDYSSIIFDYLLLEKPIIYYIPDLQDFLSTSRSLNFKFEEIAVGPQCMTFDELLRAMTLVTQGTTSSHPASRRRAEVLSWLHSHVDGDSSRRVLEALCKQVLPGACASAMLKEP
jgi:CDP-glycerol glycerophosphotransferase (TagB/SpsB family)